MMVYGLQIEVGKRNLKQFNIRLQHKTNMKGFEYFCKTLYNAFVLFVNYNIYIIVFLFFSYSTRSVISAQIHT